MLKAVTCLMEGDPWSGPKIMMWNRIVYAINLDLSSFRTYDKGNAEVIGL